MDISEIHVKNWRKSWKLATGGLTDLEALEEEIAIFENKWQNKFWDDNIA